MKPKRRRATIEACVYCNKPVTKGTVVYPHPEWRTKPGGMWLNGTRHRHCRRTDDSEYRRE